MTKAKHSLFLYHYWRSSCSWRVRWALRHKGLIYQEQTIDLRIGEQYQASYLNINPSGSVPCLLVDQQVLSESTAIIEWLEENYPKDPLLPQNAWARARVREYCGIISSTQAAQNLKVLKKVSSDQKVRAAWAQDFIMQGLRAYELRLQQWGGTYSFGSQLSMADLWLIPQVYNALRFNVNMNQYPLAHAIYQRCLNLPDCDRSRPENQQGASQSP